MSRIFIMNSNFRVTAKGPGLHRAIKIIEYGAPMGERMNSQ